MQLRRRPWLTSCAAAWRLLDVCSKTPTGDIYYFNFNSGDSIWDHPCDEHYRCGAPWAVFGCFAFGSSILHLTLLHALVHAVLTSMRCPLDVLL